MKLIIAGMHRSGTSLTASFVDAVGISMGERLLPPDGNNQKGYFEDVDFLQFHRDALKAATQADEPGVHDWGWTVSETLNREAFPEFTDRAQELIRSRDETLSAWGWKDPRTTLMLDFWDKLLPDARYLLVYRAPWDVVESMMRVGGDYFPSNPDHSLRIWAFYNRQMLDFYRAHRDRCLLFNVSSLIAEPHRMTSLIKERLGISVSDETAAERFKDLYSTDLFHTFPPEHPVVQLCRHYDPKAVEVLHELEQEADLPGNSLPPDAPQLAPERIAAWPFFLYRETTDLRTESKAREARVEARLEGELANYRGFLHERDVQLANCLELLNERDSQLANCLGYLREREAELAQVRADLYNQNLAAQTEKHQLQKQVTDLYQLNEEREKQTGELLQEMQTVYRQLDELKWENSQLSSDRDHFRLVVQSMEQTRIWRLREKVRKLTGSRD